MTAEVLSPVSTVPEHVTYPFKSRPNKSPFQGSLNSALKQKTRPSSVFGAENEQVGASLILVTTLSWQAGVWGSGGGVQGGVLTARSSCGSRSQCRCSASALGSPPSWIQASCRSFSTRRDVKCLHSCFTGGTLVTGAIPLHLAPCEQVTQDRAQEVRPYRLDSILFFSWGLQWAVLVTYVQIAMLWENSDFVRKAKVTGKLTEQT